MANFINNDFDSDTSKSALNLSVQILDDSYKRLTEQVRSLQTRSGVGLGILVASTPGLLARFSKFFPLLETAEQQRYVFFAILGAAFLIFAAMGFTDAFLNESLPDVYDDKALLDSENGLWLSNVQDLQVNRLEWLSVAISELTAIASSRIWGLRFGVVSTLVGVAIFIVMEVFVRYAHPNLVF